MPRYKSVHTGPQIDSGVSRALPGGEVDQLRPTRNLLDNWDFRNPVNQRGASGTISEAGYFIDRWKLISGTVTITANGLTLNGTIRQIRETAVGATTTASVEMYSGAATITYNDTTKYCDITSSGGTIARCKLEVGTVSTLPNDPPADYGEELRKCQRYFERIGLARSDKLTDWVYAPQQTSKITFTLRYTPKRLNSPTITPSAPNNYRILLKDKAGIVVGASNASSISTQSIMPTMCDVVVGLAYPTNQDVYVILQRTDDAIGAWIDASADL